jgi:Flp pilus assembly pilin Flp
MTRSTNAEIWGRLRRASSPEGGLVEMSSGGFDAARSQRDEGQTMSEYAVVLGVISLIVITAFGLLSTGVASLITQTAGAL